VDNYTSPAAPQTSNAGKAILWEKKEGEKKYKVLKNGVAVAETTDAGYRTKEMAPRFRQQIRGFVAQGRVLGKPVAITEFGCMTYRGAADLGGSELSLIEWDNARPARLRGDYVRDEDEQASYLSELLEVFESERVDNAFVYTFARYDLPHRSNAGEDFDLASRGIVKVLEGESSSDVRRYPGMPWEPKAAFTALSNLYAR
jgi:hypothetical protein